MAPRAANAGAVSQDGVNVMTTPSLTPGSDNLKRCYKCGEHKPREMFSCDKRAGDGLQCACKSCFAAYVRSNKERITKQRREYREANKEWINERTRQYHHANKDRRREYVNANKEQISQQKREYRRNHKEQLAEQERKYRAKNREKIRARNRQYRIEHLEERREKTRKWFAENPNYRRDYAATYPEKVRAKYHRYRARKSGNGGTHTDTDLAAIRAAQTDNKGRLICWHCGKPIKGTPQLDHWIPLKRGGSNGAGNLHYMHARCNQTKSAKHPVEIGRLL